jgi:hypothetical protein
MLKRFYSSGILLGALLSPFVYAASMNSANDRSHSKSASGSNVVRMQDYHKARHHGPLGSCEAALKTEFRTRGSQIDFVSKTLRLSKRQSARFAEQAARANQNQDFKDWFEPLYDNLIAFRPALDWKAERGTKTGKLNPLFKLMHRQVMAFAHDPDAAKHFVLDQNVLHAIAELFPDLNSVFEPELIHHVVIADAFGRMWDHRSSGMLAHLAPRFSPDLSFRDHFKRVASRARCAGKLTHCPASLVLSHISFLSELIEQIYLMTYNMTPQPQASRVPEVLNAYDKWLSTTIDRLEPLLGVPGNKHSPMVLELKPIEASYERLVLFAFAIYLDFRMRMGDATLNPQGQWVSLRTGEPLKFEPELAAAIAIPFFREVSREVLKDPDFL